MDISGPAKDNKKRRFGDFQCGDCNKSWESAFSWEGKYQECKRCGARVYPHNLRPLEYSGVDRNPNAPHPQELCEMCKELGGSCNSGYY